MTSLNQLRPRLRLPLIAAPMLRVSGPDLMIAACRNGVVGAFPTVNCRTVEQLDGWLDTIQAALLPEKPGATARPAAPLCPNLIMRSARMSEDLACLVRHKVEMVITSVGSPEAAIAPLHDIGCLVFADIASVRHAEKAIAAGADGLILLSAGAGGQTGWANPLSFIRAVRAIFDGPIVLAGGISDGWALWAAEAAGADLGYMGTKFIATAESMAEPAYKDMLVTSRLDDVLLTRAFTGLETNMLRPSILAAGLDPVNLAEQVTPQAADEKFGGGQGSADQGGSEAGPKRWKDIWSAGHSVSGVTGLGSVAALVERTEAEYQAARRRSADLLGA